MGRAKNRRRKGMLREQMNFWRKSEEQPLNRHPQSQELNLQSVSPMNCWNTIKSMFIKIEPEYKTLVFSELAWVKMQCYIRLVGEYEITGFGKIEDNSIVDLKLINQNIKSTYVDSTSESLLEFMNEVGKSEIGKWKLDWHSHVNMGTMPSGTDTQNWRDMFDARQHSQYPVMIVNKRNSVYCQCYMDYDNSIPIEIVYPEISYSESELKQIYDDCAKEVSQKCRKESQIYYGANTNYGYGTSYYRNNRIEVPEDFSAQKITSKSTVETNIKLCCFCGDELMTPNEIKNGLCNSCYDKYDKEQSTKLCKICGAELDSEEEKIGICDDCLEEKIEL